MEKQLQIVTFEQSKKLKELGFDWISDRFYNEKGEIMNYGTFNLETNYQVVPVSLALKWLRDEKNVNIHIFRYPEGNGNDKWNVGLYGIKSIIQDSIDKYEQAESAGLDYTLDYLIRDKKAMEGTIRDF